MVKSGLLKTIFGKQFKKAVTKTYEIKTVFKLNIEDVFLGMFWSYKNDISWIGESCCNHLLFVFLENPRQTLWAFMSTCSIKNPTPLGGFFNIPSTTFLWKWFLKLWKVISEFFNCGNYTLFYKEPLNKELEADNCQKNKEWLN